MRRLILTLAAALILGRPAGAAPEPTLPIDLGEGVKLEMILVKKGTFRQGSPEKEAGRGDDEAEREVTISEDFYLGKFPVTRLQYHRFVRRRFLARPPGQAAERPLIMARNPGRLPPRLPGSLRRTKKQGPRCGGHRREPLSRWRMPPHEGARIGRPPIMPAESTR